MTAVWAMAGEKSHAATPRRRQEAKRKGQGWFSPDFQAGLILLVAFLGLRWYLPWSGHLLSQLGGSLWAAAPGQGFSSAIWGQVALAGQTLLMVLMPWLGPVLALGLLSGFGQTGGRFAMGRLAPDFSRISLIKGLTRMFSMESGWQLVKGLAKIAVIGVAAGTLIAQQIRQYPGLLVMPLGQAVAVGGQMLRAVLWRATVAFFLIGILDLGYQWFKFQKDMRMTTQEVKDEMKDTEGDSRLKGRRREMARRLARTGIKAVQNSQVLVTNPTHVAVALKWDDSTMAAPEVVAKGQEELALEMRRIAYDHQVPVVENPPLARSLYGVPLGQAIPEEHYQAVADILAFVLRRRPGGDPV